MAEFECHICRNFATFLCAKCKKYMCLHPHAKRRKVDGEWWHICAECAERVDRERKAKEREKKL